MKALNSLHASEIFKSHSRPFLVVTWYRPQNSPLSVLSAFQNVIDMLDVENTEFHSARHDGKIYLSQIVF